MAVVAVFGEGPWYIISGCVFAYSELETQSAECLTGTGESVLWRITVEHLRHGVGLYEFD